MARSRVQEFSLPVSLVFAGAASAGLVVLIVLLLLGIELAINLAIVGLVLCLIVPLGLEMRNRSSRPRKALLLDFRRHPSPFLAVANAPRPASVMVARVVAAVSVTVALALMVSRRLYSRSTPER